MQLAPRFDDPAFLRLHLDLGDLAGVSARQRQRLANMLASLDDEQWAAQSRCELWTPRDVADHLATANRYWALSIDAGLRGAPTRLMAGFDPVLSPEALVERDKGAGQVLDELIASNAALDAAITRIDDWSTLAEGPPGHLPVAGVVAHALWDAWVHERDITSPLDIDTPIEDDEIRPALTYCAALGPMFALTVDPDRRGALVVEVTQPDLRVVVEVDGGVVVHDGTAPGGALRLDGEAIPVLERLSCRAPLGVEIADSQRWLVSSLGKVFGVT